MTVFGTGQWEGDSSPPESAGVIPDGLPTTRLHPHVIEFAGTESTEPYPLTLPDTSGERLWKAQVFCNIARSAHLNLELHASTLLCLNPGLISLQSRAEPHRVEVI